MKEVEHTVLREKKACQESQSTKLAIKSIVIDVKQQVIQKEKLEPVFPGLPTSQHKLSY